MIELKRGFRLTTGVLVAAAMCASLLFVAVGCGSGGEGSTTAPAAGAGEASSERTPAADRQLTTASESSGRAAKKKAENANRKAGSPLDAGKTPTAKKGGSESSKESSSQEPSPKVKRELAEACPKGMSEKGCQAYVEGSSAASKTKSTPVSDPGDCTEVMSKSECEVLLEQQKAAAQESGSVNVEQCLAHPTPHCEEVLREDLERQQAAQAAGE